MEKLKSLNRYQKCVLIFMAVMLTVFAVIYPVTVSRKGFLYHDAILVPGTENGGAVYTGKISGVEARFTVSQDKTVTFVYGDKTYGPYTAKEDPTAVPENIDIARDMTGVEIRKGDTVFFRGGVLPFGDGYYLYHEEDGSPDMGTFFVVNDGVYIDKDGNEFDPMEPSVSAILSLINGPELVHKGDGPAWFLAAAFCLVNALSIFFADELFRWHLHFSIRDTENAEPSDWEIAGRYISWTILPIVALVLLILGLR